MLTDFPEESNKKEKISIKIHDKMKWVNFILIQDILKINNILSKEVILLKGNKVDEKNNGL